MFGLDPKELKLLRSLKTPQKIQDFLNSLPINFERSRETCFSPQQVLQKRRAHCAEGAIFAAACLMFHGQKPLLLDLKTTKDDLEHIVALFRRDGRWGAISKTNHAVLRYREPVYKTVRELALSYFHEYFLNNGQKTLRAFSDPFDMSKIKETDWLVSEDACWQIVSQLDKIRHHSILTPRQIKKLRQADNIEIKAGKLKEYRPGSF